MVLELNRYDFNYRLRETSYGSDRRNVGSLGALEMTDMKMTDHQNCKT